MGEDRRIALREKLTAEADVAPWAWLAPHFARGVVLRCGPGLDPVEAGIALGVDDAATVRGWLERGLLARPTDDEARAWHTRGARFRIVVVEPFVLVGELSG